MQIVSVRLVNYRCFKDSGEVNLSKFSVLIGRNDGGKSSFLKAIDKTLNRDSNFESDDCWFEVLDGEQTRSETLEVYIRLTTKDGANCHIRSVYSRNESSTIRELESQIVDDVELNKDFEKLKKAELQELCTKFNLDFKNTDTNPTLVGFLNTYRDTLPKKSGWVELPATLISLLPRVNLYASVDETGPDKAIMDNLNKYFKNDLLSGHQRALETVREKVEKDLNSHAKSTMLPALSAHCNIVQDVSVELDETSFTGLKIGRVLITQPDGKIIDWDRIGSGKKREMALGIFRWEHEMLVDQIEDDSKETPPTVVLFDEPDVNLDYAAQRLVNQLLQELANKYPQTQVVVATHAINIIDSVPLQSLNFFESTFSPWRFKFGSEDESQLETIRQALGLSNSSLFNEKLIVVVEGSTEMSAIPSLYQFVIGQMLLLSGIYLINGLDKEQALKLATLLRKGNKEVILLLDSDCIDSKNKDTKKLGLALSDPHTEEEIKAIQAKHSLKLNEELFFLGEMEFEDLFGDEIWCEMLKKHFPVMPEQSEWATTDIENLRSDGKFSGAMIDLIDQKCSCRPGKPEIGRRIADACISLNAVPESITLVLKHMSSKLS